MGRRLGRAQARGDAVRTSSELHSAPNGARVETGTVTHEGRAYTALGSVVDHESGYVVGYVKGATLTSWEGATIGTVREVSRWPLHNSGFSTSMHSYRATIDGRSYHGRGMGEGMLLRLRACTPR